jgi:hypothetical protein
MKVRLTLSTLLAAVAIVAAGCRSNLTNLFSECDRRPSLADWFDCYGPTGCYSREGGCCPSGHGYSWGSQCNQYGACATACDVSTRGPSRSGTARN